MAWAMATRRLKPFDNVSILCSSTDANWIFSTAAATRRSASARSKPSDLRDERQEGPCGHVAVARGTFGKITELAFGKFWRHLHIDAGDARAAGIRLEEANKHLHGCRLAGSIRSEETQDFATLDLQRDSIDGVNVAEALVEIGSFDQDRH